ncbi:glycerophosphodiester phosphodiesterase 1 [Discoglossus pictus]
MDRGSVPSRTLLSGSTTELEEQDEELEDVLSLRPNFLVLDSVTCTRNRQTEMDVFPEEKVPTLKEAVRECMRLNLTIYFDVKGHPFQAAEALRNLYMEHPLLYNSSIVCSFEPSVIYKMRQADRNVVTALTHRPWSLSHFGDGKPKFSSIYKHYWYILMDVLLDWGLHNILWNFCGISAFLMQKNYISKEYVDLWNSRGIEVVAWTINTASEKYYYESFLNSSYITDSLIEDCEPHY